MLDKLKHISARTIIRWLIVSAASAALFAGVVKFFHFDDLVVVMLGGVAENPAAALLIASGLVGFLVAIVWDWIGAGNRIAALLPQTNVVSPTLGDPVSFLRLKEIAAKEYGWDFEFYSAQLLDLTAGVRQAAVRQQKTGIVIEGRKGAKDEEMKLDFPLQPIPAEHFAEWQIYPPLWSNWEVVTYRAGRLGKDNEGYRDLHISDDIILRKWLAGAANEYKTPQANIEVRDALRHMAFHTSIDGALAAKAVLVEAAKGDQVHIYGRQIWDGVGVASGHSRLTPGYWQNASLDLDSFDVDCHPSDGPYEEKQRTAAIEEHIFIYCLLRVNRERVLELWPTTKPGSPLED